MNFRLSRRKVSRSLGGDLSIFSVLAVAAAFTAMPLILIISNAFKPLNELFLYPPQYFVRNPTLNNFYDLFVLMANSWIPISRYLFNSLFIIIMGTFGNVVFGSMAAYVLSRHEFRGKKIFNEMVVISLMFAPIVLAIPRYLIIAEVGLIDSYWAIIIPSWAATLGVFLLKQFMDGMINDSIIEAAKIDGASEFGIYWKIVMPIVKPAWLTLIILTFQQLWANRGGQFIYAEHLKPLPYALDQIIGGGVARAGVGAAVALIMLIIPVIVFMINQSQIVETMGSSGID
ncbi:carbohydrate ABC transporter permease [Natronospora cellulosivora (SeqCode)]